MITHLQGDFREDADCGLCYHTECTTAASTESKENILVLTTIGRDIFPIG